MNTQPVSPPSRPLSTAFAAIATAWLLMLVAAPYLASHARAGSPLLDAGGLVYLLGHAVCHQRADRSFHAWGVQLPVCGRCTGVYAGAFAGALFALLRIRLRRWGAEDGTTVWRRRLIGAAVPTVASVALEIAGLWAQNPGIRAVAALPLGFVAAWFVGSTVKLGRS